MVVAESRRQRRVVGRLDRGTDLVASLLAVCAERRVRAGEVRAIENVLRDRMGREVALVIRSVQMSEATARGYRFITEPRPAPRPEPPPATEPPPPAANERIQKILGEQAAMVQGAKLVDFSFDASSEPPRVVATYLTTAPFDEALERGIANLVRVQTGLEVALELRYVGPLPARPAGGAGGEEPKAPAERKPAGAAKRPG